MPAIQDFKIKDFYICGGIYATPYCPGRFEAVARTEDIEKIVNGVAARISNYNGGPESLRLLTKAKVNDIYIKSDKIQFMLLEKHKNESMPGIIWWESGIFEIKLEKDKLKGKLLKYEDGHFDKGRGEKPNYPILN